MLQKIKALGFNDTQIKEMPEYYLVDGDLYFSKKEFLKKETGVKKPSQPLREKYFTLTIRVDESLSGDMDSRWREGLDQAIAEWNSDQDIHFHFALTNAADANISIVKDNDLPSDVAVASEFPSDGRTGSSIRINFAAAKTTENPKQTLLHAIKHCVGHLHSDLAVNDNATPEAQASKNAKGARWPIELYAVNGDALFRINAQTGESIRLRNGWAGTQAIGQLNGLLYGVQFGMLITASPSTGIPHPLTGGWEETVAITRTYDYSSDVIPLLYIMCGGYIWPVDENGIWGDPIGGKKWVNARGMVGSYDVHSKKRTLAVLQNINFLGGNYSYLTEIDAVDGSTVYGNLIVPSKKTGWNGYLGVVDAYTLQVFNGTLNWLTGDNTVFSLGSWLNVTSAVGSGNWISVINDGTLFHIQPEGRFMVSQIGETGQWAGVSCLVLLDMDIPW